MSGTVRFEKWHHRIDTAENALIFPDGCRDVLVVREQGKREKVLLTDLDFQPRIAGLAAGTHIMGFRLRPGGVVEDEVLQAIERDCERVEDILGNALDETNDLDDVIVALTLPQSTVERASKQAGVSVRTLQRRFREQGLPPPEYWRLLARARRAAGLLATEVPLVEIAAVCGFSDQAHMTRDLQRWFGRSPAQLRRDPDSLLLLSQPALGNWIGEQISTR
ncbi:HTH-type transcriptional activator RhaS [Labrenzia sp. THAF35]|uniref:helix-turn-helix domain-containing protein n=1 Tax=Labrenzia sp. THAF35 TaxID=2587854 RepID=UPI0012689802|nr:helix-turn-helix domain-containing protein [Labrenzia sp. THAF35]QFT68363.1 HTH-type transcriptional activator RhaS [Labrenzia sp. THAF35]